MKIPVGSDWNRRPKDRGVVGFRNGRGGGGFVVVACCSEPISNGVTTTMTFAVFEELEDRLYDHELIDEWI